MPSGWPRNGSVELVRTSPNRSDRPRRAGSGRCFQRAIMERSDHRRGDRQRDLGRSDRADVEPDRRVDPVEFVRRNARRGQPLAPRGMAPARCRARRHRRLGARARRSARDRRSWCRGSASRPRSTGRARSAAIASSGQRSSSVDAGKALLGQEARARIDHHRLDAELARQPGQRLRDLHRADDQQPARRIVAVDERRAVPAGAGSTGPVSRSVVTVSAVAVRRAPRRCGRTVRDRTRRPTPAAPSPRSRRRTAGRLPTPRHRRRRSCFTWNGAPAITSAAVARMSFSTQPPDTDPSNRPSAWTSMWLPRGRGADPQVETTVASAIGAPFQASRRRARCRYRPCRSLLVLPARGAGDQRSRERASRDVRCAPRPVAGVTGASDRRQPASSLSSVTGKSRTRTPRRVVDRVRHRRARAGDAEFADRPSPRPGWRCRRSPR